MKRIAITLGLLSALAAGQATAATHVFEFTGTVDFASMITPYDDIAKGDAIRGRLRFETPATDLVPGADSGIYHFGSPLGMTLDVVGKHVFGVNVPMNLGVLNGPVDSFYANAIFFGSYSAELYFWDFDGQAITNDQLPTVPYPMNVFETRRLSVTSLHHDGIYRFSATIDSLTAASDTPEPATATLLLVGSALAFLRRRRAQKG